MKEIKKKMRIQLFDPDFNMQEDRLVQQDIELTRGPNEIHNGPLKVEICLFDQQDIDNFKLYLDKLRGELPLEVKRKKYKKRISAMSPNYRDELSAQIKSLIPNGEAVKSLRDQGFIFTSVDFLKDLGLPITFPEGIDYTEFRWMVKLIKQAKNPINNKYDVSLLFGINKLSKNKGRFILTSAEELLVDMEGPLSLKEIKVPSRFKIKFPVFLTPEERVKLSLEIAALKKDETLKPSKLYRRWVWAIKKENEGRGIEELPRIDTIPNPYV